jgi:hypothetical protein
MGRCWLIPFDVSESITLGVDEHVALHDGHGHSGDVFFAHEGVNGGVDTGHLRAAVSRSQNHERERGGDTRQDSHEAY